jgi:hypothetical protein
VNFCINWDVAFEKIHEQEFVVYLDVAFEKIHGPEFVVYTCTASI